ncbi:MAG: AI-2E family transporter [Methanoregula sp.]|nr:MAG: AI-2E family transporter [Methanoregula sp.]
MGQFRADLVPFVIMLAILAATLIIFWKLLDVLVFAISIAVVIFPLHTYFRKYINRYFSAALITIFIFVALVATALLSITILSDNSSTLQEIVGTIENWVKNPSTDPRVFGIPVERIQVSTWLEQAKSIFFRYWTMIFSDITTIALKVIVFFASLYVLLLHGETLKKRIMAGVPENIRIRVQKMSDGIVDTLYAIYVVHIGIAALTFVIAIPFFWFLGYGNVLFYSFLCAFCELIPVLGSSIVFIFLGTYALSIGDINGVLILFFFGYIGVSALPEIYVRPVLMGRRVRLHPLLMLIGFFGGLITMGMAGFVLGPVFIVLLFNGYKILIEERKDAGRAGEEHGPV